MSESPSRKIQRLARDHASGLHAKPVAKCAGCGRYRTIVADPPWPIAATGINFVGGRSETFVPYPTMSIDDIAAIPVRSLSVADFSGPTRARRRAAEEPARDGSHLFLWCTTSTMEPAHEVARGWGFEPSALLVWCKESRGFSVGGVFQANVEFVVYARRGSPSVSRTVDSRWFRWPRGAHSAKPEAFLDLVESVCGGPYLELFARRQRLGWDTWGNEALEHVTMADAPQGAEAHAAGVPESGAA